MSFATDAWTSPNQRAYVVITVHLEQKGEPISLLLDIVEVAQSHTRVNLAAAFTKILDDYGISDKVLISTNLYIYQLMIILTRFWGLPVITRVITM